MVADASFVLFANNLKGGNQYVLQNQTVTQKNQLLKENLNQVLIKEGDVKKGRTAKKRKNIESTMVSISVT